MIIADSDAGARRVFVRFLERFKFEVHQAADGDTALELLETCSAHVVIAELTLPRDDAFQASIRARGIPYIVTVTNPEAAIPADAIAVLEKPFTLATLLAEVRRALRLRNPPLAA